MGEPATLDEVRAWPALVSLTQAARALNISRTTAFTLAAKGQFPVPLERALGQQRVRTADLIRYLEADGGASS
ncbi:helix-turn-helix transcriptional regulator [Streptomyces phaeochromogenes]|uniref:helix-turn-helix transcriptional regulator n=1 Tax=Streptomyces phaeochromogenes TaxID=1923 RepID=UPI00371FB819|nr:helix-turn-helix domain-containing protein [Streptomyces phaeochromogenes]